MSIAILGAGGLFSLLQEVFWNVESSRPRIRLTKAVHGFLEDFHWIATDIALRQTWINKLVPSNSALKSVLIGAYDTTGNGNNSGVFIPTDDDVVPILWQKAFPKLV